MNEELRELARQLLANNALAFSRPAELTLQQAYELQAEIARQREERGDRIIGYKIGCTSQAIRDQLGVAEPIFGRIFDSGCSRSGARVSYSRYTNLAVEGELAVRLSKDLPGQLHSEQESLEAIQTVFPVIELHNYFLQGTWPPGAELIARNGLHAGFVAPEEETPWCRVDSLSIRVNGFVVDAVASSSTIMTDLHASLRWLATRLADFGLQLHKGEVILTGSLMKLHPVAPGSTIVVEAPPLPKSYVQIDP